MITNAGYNNSNVTGLVYLTAFVPDEGESLADFVPPESAPPGFLILTATQKPFNQSIINEKSGPPAWKQLPTWYQVSEDDSAIPPDAERMFAQRINATTLSINASHIAPVTHSDEIAQFI